MNTSRVYQKEEFWFVDFIDSNYELLPAVGVFKTQYEAIAAAEKWKNETIVENMGESSW